ncbi:hypothetical protein BDM02DRAFT_3130398 [Thelephora ganbajun]|uniref:Uncharacterized protein n=1 Tax=Thelephora ganbajun TaxID=370292 RepID=A0ACB6ZA26_THEGA|nr:hypothetical protein BDM02DRAFT_3130398 [Thelephora ganbajun]
MWSSETWKVGSTQNVVFWKITKKGVKIRLYMKATGTLILHKAPEVEGGKEAEGTEQTNPHKAMPNSTLGEDGEEPSELPPPTLNGEGIPNPRPLAPPPSPPVVINIGLFNPEVTPNSAALGPLFLLLEFFKSGEGDIVVDEGTEWVLFLDFKVWVGRVPGLDTELPFASREPGEFPNELDLSIDELVANFNGLGPLDKDCVRGGLSIAPNSDVLGILLSDGLALNVRGPGVDERGGGSMSSSSRGDGNRVLADEAVLRVLLLMEDCLV